MPNLVIVTGAGISAESGISTFRDKDGTWSKFNSDDLSTPGGFARDPERVHAFYNTRRLQLATVEPNAAHRALAELEEAWEGGFIILTQNVDGLHEAAGSKNILHVHGQLDWIKCISCDFRRKELGAISTKTLCEKCGEPMRPDVVWFEEYPHHLDIIEKIFEKTDILLVIGTSGSVMPVSLFPSYVRQANPCARIIQANLETYGDPAFDEEWEGLATEVVPELVKELKEKYCHYSDT